MSLVSHNIDEIISRHPEADLIRHILNLPAISAALSSGAYIAGGFARVVLLGKRVSTYLFGHGNRGDVDLFFSSREQIEYVTHVIRGASHRSFGGNAREYSHVLPYQCLKPYEHYAVGSSFTLQVVDKEALILPIREQLERFDFVNVRCAFNYKEMLADDRITQLEADHLLQVSNSMSPYLSSRIIKYIKKGYITITDDSREHVTDWIIRALAGEFDAFYPEKTRDAKFGKLGIQSLISGHSYLLRNEDLIMLLGMFKQEVRGNKYGPSTEIDMALSIIENRQREARNVATV